MPSASDYRTCVNCGAEVCLMSQGMNEVDLFECDKAPFHVFCKKCFPEVEITEEQEDTREVSSTVCPICNGIKPVI